VAGLVLFLSFAALAQSAADASEFEKGRQQFHRTCAQCHGRNMVSSGVTVYDLRKFPIDQQDRFIASVVNGKGNMPSFKDALTSEQIRALWGYVSSRGAVSK
jgi:mono/diheme cytochrome c family protein